MQRILIVNPFASGVTERKLAAVQAILPVGTETVLTQATGEQSAVFRAGTSSEHPTVWARTSPTNPFPPPTSPPRC